MPYHHDDGPPLFAYAMLAVFIAVFASEYTTYLSQLHAYPWRIADGETWRLVTCTVLHGSVVHVAFNVILFFRFATVVDRWMGPWVAMLMYVFFGASSSAAQLLVSNSLIVGASGVVYAYFGFLWVMSRRRDDAAEAANQHTVQTLLGWLAVCFFVTLFGARIANTAHVWGLLLGWMMGQVFVARKKWRPWMVAATLFLGALPVSLTSRVVWERTLAHVPYLNLAYPMNIPADSREMIENPIEVTPPQFWGLGG